MVAGHLQEKNGYFYAVLSYKDAQGKRKTKWIPTGYLIRGNKKKAEAFLMEQRQTFQLPAEDTEAVEKGELFADYLERWLKIAKSTIAITTYSSYDGMMKSTIVPWFRKTGVTITELTAQDIQDFYTAQLARVKSNTVIHYHALIHRALKYAVKTDQLSVNPADKVDRPRKNGFQPAFYDKDEINQLLACVKGTLIETPVMLAAFYGLRRSEAVGLRWDAIDFHQNTITIQHTVIACRLNGKYEVIARDTTKTKSSRRTLPLAAPIRKYLLDLQVRQAENRRLCGNCYCKDYEGYICINEMGYLLNPNRVSAMFELTLRQNHLRHIRFHDLRHPYVKHTTKIFSLRLMDFQAQAYPDARRKTRGACQLLRVGQSRSPVRPLCNRKRFSCLPPQSKMSWILYAISMRLSGYTSTRSISSSASSVVSVSASKIALDASMRLSCRACSSCFCFACANTAA